MKRLTIFIIVTLIALSCTKKQENPFDSKEKVAVTETNTDSSNQKLEDSREFTRESLEKLYTNTPEKQELSPESYETLIRAHAKCVLIDNKHLDYGCPAIAALENAPLNALDPERAKEIRIKLSQSKDVGILLCLLNHGFSVFNMQDDERAALFEIAKTETHPAVLLALLTKLNWLAGSFPEARAFILKMLEQENPSIREAAVTACLVHLTEDGEVVTKLVQLLNNDTDKKVQKNICLNIASFKIDNMLDILNEILADESKADLHDDCMLSVTSLWWNSPEHNSFNENAYKQTLAYLQKTPRNEDSPSWLVCGRFAKRSESNFENWRQKATWYVESDLLEALSSVVKDKNAGQTARISAVESLIANHYEKEKLTALIEPVKQSGSENDTRFILEKIREGLASEN